MYGDSSIKSNKYLRLIIELIHPRMDIPKSEDRIRLSIRKTDVLGVSIPTLSLPVATGRNLAVLVEAAVRDHLLILNGYNASEDFIEQQKIQCAKDK